MSGHGELAVFWTSSQDGLGRFKAWIQQGDPSNACGMYLRRAADEELYHGRFRGFITVHDRSGKKSIYGLTTAIFVARMQPGTRRMAMPRVIQRYPLPLLRPMPHR